VANATTVPPAQPVPVPAVQASLNASIKDGVAWSFMHGFGERYVGPLVIKGGSSLFALALLSILPSIAGALVQLVSAGATDIVRRRKRMLVWGAAVQAFTWAPACVAVFLPAEPQYWLILASFVLYLAVQNFTVPPWASVMGDLVPAERRGRYFGLRNVLTGAAMIVAFFLGGAWLEASRRRPDIGLLGLEGESFGFLVLFVLAGFARLVSVYYLALMIDPPYHPERPGRFDPAGLFRLALKGDFGRFTIYATAVHFGVAIAGAYFGWYVFRVLEYTSFEFAVLFTAPLITLFATQPVWGRLADRVGNRKVIAIGGFGIALIPVLWLFSTDFAYLCAVQIYDGVVWAAFEISCWNYLFDAVPPPRRARLLACKTLLVSIGGAAGVLVGAAVGVWFAYPLATPLGSVEHPFAAMLILSAAFRLIPNLLFLRSFREMRVGGTG
jgi:MFS family permease